MKTQHSPAPWKFDGILITDKNGKIIYNVNRTQTEHQANSNLIAAAPELLEALQKAEIVLWMHSNLIAETGYNPTDAINKATAAINKALGNQ